MHTPEPWGLMNDGPDPKRDLLTPWQAYGETITGGLTIASPHNTEPICRVSGCCQPVAANAQRIILCVNALAGVPDEALREALLFRETFARLPPEELAKWESDRLKLATWPKVVEALRKVADGRILTGRYEAQVTEEARAALALAERAEKGEGT